MLAYSIIFSIVKAYSRILRHYLGIFKLIEAYSALCVTLTYSQRCDILNPGIFRPEGYLKSYEKLTRHIQNPVIEHYSVILRYIQNLKQCLHTQKAGILGVLEYSEPFHNCILRHIQNPVISTKI